MDKPIEIVVGIVVMFIVAVALVVMVTSQQKKAETAGSTATDSSQKVIDETSCNLKCSSCRSLYGPGTSQWNSKSNECGNVLSQCKNCPV